MSMPTSRRTHFLVTGLALLSGLFAAFTLHARPGKKLTAQERDARTFLDIVTGTLQPPQTVANQAAWTASTDVTPEHTAARTGAEKALAAVSGSKLVIDKTKAFLAQKGELEPVTVRQLEKLLLDAAESPATIPEVVAKRIEVEGRQSAILDGYTFCLQSGAGGACVRPTSANDIDDILRKSRNLKEREAVWIASKEIGRKLRPGLVELQALRNKVAREMGY